MTSRSDIIDELVDLLRDRSRAIPAGAFPRGGSNVDEPGLYAWWADDSGLDALSEPFSARLSPLIYAGQAGASSSRTMTPRSATLRSRIGGNHLRGNISSSTFRKTLTAVLFTPLDLRLAKPGRLEPASNRQISEWMGRHLSLGVVPYPDRDTLAAVEGEVLLRLDPPLNLMGMPTTVIRRELRTLRARLARPS
jgi:hypothetical protein